MCSGQRRADQTAALGIRFPEATVRVGEGVMRDSAVSGPRKLIVGRVTGVYGVKGFVRVFSEMTPRAAIAEFAELYWTAVRPAGVPVQWQRVAVAEGRAHGPGVVLRFDGVNERDGAAAWMGRTLAIDRDWLPELDDGEVYWADLIGLEVVNRQGETLGRVARLFETGANDVVVVQGDRERLIPWVRGRFVDEVDLTSGVLRVDWASDW